MFETIAIAGAAMLLMLYGVLCGIVLMKSDWIKFMSAMIVGTILVASVLGGSSLLGLITPAILPIIGAVTATMIAVGVVMTAYYGIDWILDEVQWHAELAWRDRKYEQSRVFAQRDRLLAKLLDLIPEVEKEELRSNYRQIAGTLHDLVAHRNQLRAHVEATRALVRRLLLPGSNRRLMQKMRESLHTLEQGFATTEHQIDEVLLMLDAAECQLRISLAVPHMPVRDRTSEVRAIRAQAIARPVDTRPMEEQTWLLQSPGRYAPRHSAETDERETVRFDEEELTTTTGVTSWYTGLELRLAAQRDRERAVLAELGQEESFREQMARATGNRPPEAPVARPTTPTRTGVRVATTARSVATIEDRSRPGTPPPRPRPRRGSERDH